MSSDTAAEWVVVEPGPGKVLSGLWKDTEYGAKWVSTPCGTADAIEQVAAL